MDGNELKELNGPNVLNVLNGLNGLNGLRMCSELGNQFHRLGIGLSEDCL